MPRKAEYDRIKADPERYQKHRQAQIAYRQQNPDAIGDFHGQRDRRRAKRVNYVRKILDESTCASCGESNNDCLQFHHVDPTQKDRSITQMSGYSLARIKAEIAKCVILCANCHCKEHARIRRGEPGLWRSENCKPIRQAG